MTYAWQMEQTPRSLDAAALMPPSMIEETAWDILLALQADHQCELSIEKLGLMVSAPPRSLNKWLAYLEESELVSGLADAVTSEVRAILTPTGRAVLDRYISATSDLQFGAHHP